MSIVTVEIARSRLGLAATATHRDDEIQGLIDAAEEHVEDLSGHILEKRQVAVPLIAFDCAADVFAWPIVSVDGLSYVDADGVAQEADGEGLRLVGVARPKRIQVGEGSWPSDFASDGVLAVTAGYANLADVPPKLVQAVLVLVGQWFEDPDGQRPISPQVKSLCWSSRNAL